MADYISREAVLKCVDEDGYFGEYDLGYGRHNLQFQELLKEIPAADVRPVVRGKWEKHEDFDAYGGGRFVEWVCSDCDKRLRGDWVIRNSHIEETPPENYCPNCGADMREEG